MENEFNVAAAGLGVNTVAYLIECTKQQIIFDFIIFADPGKENPLTYQYIPILNKWLLDNGQPELTIVFKVDKYGDKLTLYDDNINILSLPSIVYGYKKCSQKYKIQPTEKFLNNNTAAQTFLKTKKKINIYKGIDADEKHRVTENPNKNFKNIYPLVDLDMGRFECVKTILDNGLPLPPKSSCTFCPSMKPWEIIELYETQRQEFYDAIKMENNARPTLTTIKGLGRDFSWWDLILAYKYLKIVKRHNSIGNVPDRIKRLMSKVNKSKPIDYEKLANQRITPQQSACDLFSQNINLPCECMN